MERVLPNFLIIGAPKCGTSSLWRYLRAHPQVFLPRIKEPCFFAPERDTGGFGWRAAPWTRGLGWYAGLFAKGGMYPARGEASTCYTSDRFAAVCAERIARHLTEARLIYLVREPVQRLRSHYFQHLNDGDLPSRLRLQTILDHGSAGEGRLGRLYQNIVLTGLYHRQLSHYLRYFAVERVLVLRNDALLDDRANTLQRVYRFLGIDETFMPPDLHREYNRLQDKVRFSRPFYALMRMIPGGYTLLRKIPQPLKDYLRRNVAPKHRQEMADISPAQEAWLRQFFAPDLRQFEALTGIDTSDWRQMEQAV